jgi:3-hydroxyacyl-[acyl-carrier-protein] dehydratase
MSAAGFTPHGPGFSFLDEVSFDAASGVLDAKKFLDPGMPVFKDHFPGKPLFPAVLLAEAAAQASGVLWGNLKDVREPVVLMLAEIGKFRVKRPVPPGETLVITTHLEREFGTLAQFSVEISTENGPAAAGSITLAEAPAPA